MVTDRIPRCDEGQQHPELAPAPFQGVLVDLAKILHHASLSEGTGQVRTGAQVYAWSSVQPARKPSDCTLVQPECLLNRSYQMAVMARFLVAASVIGCCSPSWTRIRCTTSSYSVRARR